MHLKKLITVTAIATLALPARSNSAIIIEDTFLGTGTYSLGQTFAPTTSVPGTKWEVSNGTVKLESGLGTLNGDFAAMTISFGTIAPNTPATVSFDLNNRHWTTGGYRFDFSLNDSSTGKSYTEKATPSVGYFGTSGFNSYNGAGDLIAGAKDKALSSDGTWDKIVMTFDPTTGVSITQNGTLVASWSNFNSMTKVDSFSVSAPIGTAPYSMMNFKVDAVPEPSSLALLGIGGVMLLKRKTGRRLNK